MTTCSSIRETTETVARGRRSSDARNTGPVLVSDSRVPPQNRARARVFHENVALKLKATGEQDNLIIHVVAAAIGALPPTVYSWYYGRNGIGTLHMPEIKELISDIETRGAKAVLRHPKIFMTHEQVRGRRNRRGKKASEVVARPPLLPLLPTLPPTLPPTLAVVTAPAPDDALDDDRREKLAFSLLRKMTPWRAALAVERLMNEFV